MNFHVSILFTSGKRKENSKFKPRSAGLPDSNLLFLHAQKSKQKKGTPMPCPSGFLSRKD